MTIWTTFASLVVATVVSAFFWAAPVSAAQPPKDNIFTEEHLAPALPVCDFLFFNGMDKLTLPYPCRVLANTAFPSGTRLG